MAAYVGDSRRMTSYGTYSEAMSTADQLVREMSHGSQAALTTAQTRGVLAVLDAVESFRRERGQTISAVRAITEYLAAVRKLGDRPLSDAVDGFLGIVATVKRMDWGRPWNTSRAANTRPPRPTANVLNSPWLSLHRGGTVQMEA
ncbi:MAG: hypothetical protein HY043_11840 [Verrucomicrobia bacterium]|nr:hypothetical protein [Verrucomicrobiota bacterium]